MARIRSIKPDFWTDEKIVNLSAFARLLFIGLWNFVDDEGRGEYSPIGLKLKILPADSIEIDNLLSELRAVGLIRTDGIGGSFEIVDFSSRWQTITSRPAIPRDIRLFVHARDGDRCVYCGADEGPFQLDHVIPWSRGGEHTVDNLVVACRPCNSSKRAKTPDEWLR